MFPHQVIPLSWSAPYIKLVHKYSPVPSSILYPELPFNLLLFNSIPFFTISPLYSPSRGPSLQADYSTIPWQLCSGRIPPIGGSNKKWEGEGKGKLRAFLPLPLQLVESLAMTECPLYIQTELCCCLCLWVTPILGSDKYLLPLNLHLGESEGSSIFCGQPVSELSLWIPTEFLNFSIIFVNFSLY